VGMCGINAECFVSNHAPSCACISGFTGNPSTSCHEIPKSMTFTSRPPLFRSYSLSLSLFCSSRPHTR
jgi:hypothetical protein